MVQRKSKRKIRHVCLSGHDCSLYTSFLYLRFHHCHKTLHLFIYHDCRHLNCSGTTYIKSPRTPNLFLGIYPREIIGQVPKRCMYKIVCCRVLYRSKRLQMRQSLFRCLLSWIAKSYLQLLQLHLAT